MNCCSPLAEAAPDVARTRHSISDAAELRLGSLDLGGGRRQLILAVPDVHCGACIRTVEGALGALPGVESARVNLSTRRVHVVWREESDPSAIVGTLDRIGYPPHLFAFADDGDETFSRLIRAVGVAGFAAMNIMLLSVAVWSGADGATRDLFHWISALIAAPALVYSGRIFFVSAYTALRAGRLNMDVPISLGVILAFLMSLYETATHGEHAYFDAATALLFFLLAGRTLDHLMRERARDSVKNLAQLVARGATILRPDGTRAYLPVDEVARGDVIVLAAGDRIPVDGVVREGASDIDWSLVTGESQPVAATPGVPLKAGTLNLSGPLLLEAVAPARESFLAEMVRLMEAAEHGRAAYRRLADRVSAIYAPVVHIVAASTFLGWMAVTGDWHFAITTAVATLIITCPCALGLAVPMVQVVAAGRLFEAGILLKDGSALERLATADMVVFDKTGTLTSGAATAVEMGEASPAAIADAAALAARSAHPVARAIAALGSGRAGRSFAAIRELPGLGIEAESEGAIYRLGSPPWSTGSNDPAFARAQTIFSRDQVPLAAFDIREETRKGAAAAVSALAAAGYRLELLSGDRPQRAKSLARRLGIAEAEGGQLPAQKVSRIEALRSEGRSVLMVGDGLNDAPALKAADVSMAPSGAADVGRNAADLVFLREDLGAVPLALSVARRATSLIRQNFALAIGYNLVAVPAAILGYATPLIAAVAMSTSSIIVVANALRLSTRGSSPVATATEPDVQLAIEARAR